MSRESILRIRETEDEAARIVREAQERARATVAAAEAAGRKLCEDTERDTASALAETLGQIRARTEALAERIEAESAEEIEELEKQVALRRKIAEKIIVREVEKKCR